MTLPLLEEMRERLRGLVPFLDKKVRRVVYTALQDEVLTVREDMPIVVPRMTGAQWILWSQNAFYVILRCMILLVATWEILTRLFGPP